MTPQELWENNRGDWRWAKKRIARERWAALNYQDRVVLVAELHGPDHETVADSRTGRPKRALVGRPLPPGDPVREALMGAQVEYRRNPISHDPDPETDQIGNSGETRDASSAAPTLDGVLKR